jgi:hypothetical protein
MTAEHIAHDRLLIAAYAAGDAEGDDGRRARLLVEGCEDCRLLAADLRAIASASRDLAAWHPARPRDYRLSREEAATAARRGGVRSRVAGLLGLTGATIRQAGLGLATLGLVGILVTGAGLTGAGLTGAGLGATRGTGIEAASGGTQFGAQAAPTDAKAGGSPGSLLAPVGSGAAVDTRQASPNAAAPAPVGGAREISLETIVGVASVVLLVAGVLLLLTPAARQRRRRS